MVSPLGLEPDCYKMRDEVLAEMDDSIRILHVLTLLSVAMAGADVSDAIFPLKRSKTDPG